MNFHSPAGLVASVQPAPAPVLIGACELLNSDGSYNVANIMRMAHIRARGELQLCRIAQARGLIAATCKLTYARELKGELRQCWDLARGMWSAHSANQSRVTFVPITPFGRQVEGVRRSAF